MTKLALQWKGPAKILISKSSLNYKVQLLDNSDQKETVQVANLKPYYGGGGGVTPSSGGV